MFVHKKLTSVKLLFVIILVEDGDTFIETVGVSNAHAQRRPSCTLTLPGARPKVGLRSDSFFFPYGIK